MLDRLPRQVRTALDLLERLAKERSLPVCLVGGAVRDLLLERPVLDIDLAVEGDAPALARAAAEELPVEIRVHEAFGTATLRWESGRRIDLAATRRERYDEIAALPRVEPAPLAEDLIRRDFTVNSMAVPLGDSLEALVDPSGGRDDLEERRLRVHHERSFLDDPTRILRGVRFEARLGFRLEATTEQLALEASSSALGRLSADRLRAELELLFEEPRDPVTAWRRLWELGVLEAAGLRAAVDGSGLLSRIHYQLAGWPEWHPRSRTARRAEALLTGVLLVEEPGNRSRVAARLGLPIGMTERFEELLELLERPELPAHAAAAELQRLSVEELVAVDAVGGRGASSWVAKHLESQREFKLLIDGATLLAQGATPGPEIGRALLATRHARLDGLITEGEELAYALAALRGGSGVGENGDA